MKIKTTAGAVLALSVLSTPFAVQAAEQTGPVIVTATRTAQIADASVAPVIVIDQQTLQQNPGADVEDILRMYAGIEISRNGGPGQTTSLFIRGAESNHTLVMIDGVKINPGTIGAAALQNIDLSMIDHIEIVKGPRSTLYGSEAIGGVINIITTRRKIDGTDFTTAVEAGSYDTQSLKLAAHHLANQRGAGIEISGTRSKGFPTRIGTSIDRGYNNLNIHLYGSQHIGNTDYDISHWQSTGKTEYMDFSINPVDQDFENAVTAINAKTVINDSWISKLKLSHTSDKIDQNQSSDYAHTNRYAIDWQNDMQWSLQNLLSAGLYHSQENTRASVYGTKFDIDTEVNAVYIQNVWRTKTSSLVSGIRYTDHQTFGDNTSWNVEYGVNLGKNFRLTLANNAGFRAPDSTDRFGFGGNPTLKPEKSNNSEIGLRYEPGKHQHIMLNAYRNRITDLAEYNNLTNKIENIGQVTITGSELVYELLGEHWSGRAGATLEDPHNDINNTQLLRRSKHAYSLQINYHANRFAVGLEAYYSGTRPDIDANTYLPVTLDPYTLINLSSRYQFSSNLSLSLRIENLTDEDYQVASGYNTPGRSAYSELRYNL